MEQTPASVPAPTRVHARPLGITIIAIVAAVFGVLGLLAGLALFGLSGMLGVLGGASLAGQSMMTSLLALATSVLALGFAYGAWKLKPWAWPLGIAFAGLAAVSAVLGLVTGDSEFGSAVIGLVIGGVVVAYLMTPGVKAAFGRT